MSEVRVRKRYGGEWLDIREFVRPQTLMVRDLARSLPQDLAAVWGWVVRNVRYPLGSDDILDLHQEGRYLTDSGDWLMQDETDEFWEYPSEVLRDRVADCEGTSALLVSLGRHFMGPEEIYCTVGTWNGFGHVWVSVPRQWGWEVLETTLDFLPRVRPVEEQEPYRPILRFNDETAAWVRPGALPDRVRDPEKRRLITGAWMSQEAS